MWGRLAGSVGGAPDFGSGHDLTLRDLEARIRLSTVSVEPALDPLPPSLSAPSPPLKKEVNI